MSRKCRPIKKVERSAYEKVLDGIIAAHVAINAGDESISQLHRQRLDRLMEKVKRQHSKPLRA